MSKEKQATFFDGFYEYYLKRVKGETVSKNIYEKNELREFALLTEHLFSFLLRHENKDFYRSGEQIKDAFEKGLICIDIYHIGTDEYNDLLNRKPELKKIKENEYYEVEEEDSLNHFDKLSTVYLKACNTISVYEKIVQKPHRIGFEKVLDVSPELLLEIQRILPRGAFTTQGIRMPNEFMSTILKDNAEGDFFLQKKDGDKWIIKKKVYIDNFFQDGFYKLYNAKGEEVDKSIISYNKIIKKIRNSVAHTQLNKYELNNGQTVAVFKIPKDDKGIKENYSVVINYFWFWKFCKMGVFDHSKNYRFVCLPDMTKAIETKEEYDEFLESASLLNIKFSESADTERLGFDNYVRKLVSLYKKDKNIKISLIEYLTKNISKYYSGVEIKTEAIQNIPNLWMRFNNSITKEKMSTLNLYTLVAYQNNFFNKYLNEYFINLVNNNEIDDFRTLSASFVANNIVSYFRSFTTTKKLKTNYRIGFEVEDLVSLCQLLIFEKLINNALYEDIKKVYKSYKKEKKRKKIIDIKYLDSEEGKLRQAIIGLDMSKFEIIDTRGKTPPRSAESLGDKLLVIRLLRNSISHKGFAYQLAKTNQIFDTYLRLTSYKNPHLQLRVRIKHLLDLLNLDLFKFTYNNNPDNIITIKELEEIAKTLCLTDEDDDDDIDFE